MAVQGNILTAFAAGALGASGILVSLLRNPTWSRRILGHRNQIEEVSTLHPDYKPGDKQPSPFTSDKYLALNPAELGDAMYPFMISAVVPRPVAFVSSLSKNGAGNLSPYSYFNAMSHDPPMVVIGHSYSSAKKDTGGKKDTLANILETGEFVVNIMNEWYVEAANFTCGPYDRGINEMTLSGLTPMESVKVKPPRVKESAVHFECKLVHSYEIKNHTGKATGMIVVGEVLLAHMHEEVATKSPHSGHDVVDLKKYSPVSRLGGVSYGRTTEYYNIPRPPKEEQKTPKTASEADEKARL
ncbi:hypothetical protein KFL_000570380 [Klebsormidium nitens]|uniref:Flavin reductase like domain-containing protein n=1 Tax=Klebsormidium nitens TaxID=105231 RepID=A0A0U9HKG9_KLENI|nr:hypothetical protein KFL_000570380 [Klebsormidium nitens]|eukprot:GAQ80591.1 hypothetical protein KFL_000570380 [Klebsormidium nitens]